MSSELARQMFGGSMWIGAPLRCLRAVAEDDNESLVKPYANEDSFVKTWI